IHTKIPSLSSSFAHYDPAAKHLTLKGYSKNDILVAAFHIHGDRHLDEAWTYATTGSSHTKSSSIR
ncbi:hypothetical protein DXG01_016838, partial [Tephrocybe rancida]